MQCSVHFADAICAGYAEAKNYLGADDDFIHLMQSARDAPRQSGKVFILLASLRKRTGIQPKNIDFIPPAYYIMERNYFLEKDVSK